MHHWDRLGAFTVSDDHVYDSAGTFYPQIQINDGFQTVTLTETATLSAASMTLSGGFMQGEVTGGRGFGRLGTPSGTAIPTPRRAISPRRSTGAMARRPQDRSSAVTGIMW